MARVIQYPHPLLRKRMEYDPNYDDDWVIDRLLAAVKEEEESRDIELIGIAANQIGIETRIILYKDANAILQPIINPEIVVYRPDEKWEEPWVEFEACGSLPDYVIEVQRARDIKITLDKYPFRWEIFSGDEARIIQHEVDHLNGILIIDREYNEQA